MVKEGEVDACMESREGARGPGAGLIPGLGEDEEERWFLCQGIMSEASPILPASGPDDEEAGFCTQPPGCSPRLHESCGLAPGRLTPILLSRRGGEAPLLPSGNRQS